MGNIVVNKEWVWCNLCKRDDFEPVFVDPKTGYGHGYCKGCGLIYIRPRMDAVAREGFYSTYAQKYPESFLIDQNNPYRQIAKKRAEFFVSFLKDYGYQVKSLLEVGCSYGFFLKELSEYGSNIDLHGVEPSSPQGNFAVDVMGVKNIQQGMVEDINPAQKRFDVIALFHVLEHVGNPASLLKYLYTLLNPGGLVWVEVPDAAQLNGDLIEFQHFISCQHLYEFSHTTLKQALEYACFAEIILENVPLGFFLQSNQRAIFKRNGDRKGTLYKDPDSHSFLSMFHSRVGKLKNEIETWLDMQGRAKRDVLIYGGGFHTMGLIGLIDLNRFPIKAIIDDDPAKHGNEIEGIPVTGPSVMEDMRPGAILISTLVSERPLFERLKPMSAKGWHIRTIYMET